MNALSPIILAISNYYGFSVEWCDELEKWIVKGEEMNCAFYWNSQNTDDDFLDALKEYFEEIGSERVER